MSIRTRFAPSPTGSLHVGGARTALYCLLQARREGGRFLLRIEDTDQARSTEEAAAGILRDLRWLGLDWDEGPGAEDAGTGPYFQSQRLELYDRYVDALLASGHAYLAWDSTEELDAWRKEAERNKQNFRYRWRPTSPEDEARWRAEGRQPVVRLKAPSHPVHFTDDVLGEVAVAVEELEDIVIRKADGFPTYHFAVVIDDHHMQVTQVLRGQEHLMNTPKHLGAYEALGWSPPSHGHLPLIFNPAGGKMSKRDKAKAARAAAIAAGPQRDGEGPAWAWLAERAGRPLAEITAFVNKQHDGVATAEAVGGALGVDLPMIEVMDFRKGGYLPEALLNYLALLGWSPGEDREIMTIAEMTALFSVDGINKTAARFDAQKLLWLNGETIRRSTLDRLLEVQERYLEVVPTSPFVGMERARRAIFLQLYQARMTTFADLDRTARFFFVRPTSWEQAAVDKHVRKGGGIDNLRAAVEALQGVEAWEAPAIDAALHALSERTGVGVGKYAQPLRVAVTGAAVSPPIGDTLALLGRDEVLARAGQLLASL